MDAAPVLPPTCPLFRNIHHGQIQHLQQAVIGWEHGFRLGNLAELAVKALNGVGGVDHSANLIIKKKITSVIFFIMGASINKRMADGI